MKNSIANVLKDASYITVGNLLGKLFRVFAFVYIVNSLGVEDYGLFLSIITFVGLFEIINLSGINKYGVREGSKNINNLQSLLPEIFIIKFFSSILAFITTISFYYFFMENSLYEVYLISLFSFSFFINSINGFYSIIIQSSDRLRYLSIFPIVTNLSYAILATYLVKLGYGVKSLLMITLFSSILVLVISIALTHNIVKYRLSFSTKINPVILKSAFILSLISFFIFLSNKIDIIMISTLSSKEEVGIYGVAYFPINQFSLMKNAIALAIFPYIVRELEKKEIIFSSLIHNSMKLFFFFFTFATICYFSSEKVIQSLFSKEFQDSHGIFQVLIFSVCFSACTLPFSKALIATGNESISLYFHIFSALLNIPLNYILYINYGLIGFAYSTLIVSFLKMCLIFLISIRTLHGQGYLRYEN